MKLKKININLAKALEEQELAEPRAIQKQTFGTIKSGADCVIEAPKSEGKTTTIVINVIQRLEKAFEQSPRALIFVESKEKVQEMEELFEMYGNYTDLRVYGVHEKGDVDYDKNVISAGIDVLIGTPGKLNDMFATAGFDVNQLKMFVVDDAEALLKLRHDGKIVRISDSVQKSQRVIFTDVLSARVESLADRIMREPFVFEFTNEDDEQ